MSADSGTMTGPPPIPYAAVSPPPLQGVNDAVTTGNDLAPLVWRGLLLTVVTLGIYRFWYKTDLRRWYWRNTVVGGTALEYRGTAKELFIGFLFALAIMVPLYVLIASIGLFAGEDVAGLLQGGFGLLIVFLVQYGAFRSRRYRLTRTVWRGVRFDQTGSAVGYALRSMGWFLATALTGGMLFPLMRRALERYRVCNTRFGSATGTFDAPVAPLMKRWLALIVPPVVLIGVGLAEGMSAAQSLIDADQPYSISIVFGAVLVLLGVLWPLLLWPVYRAAEFRLFTNGTSIGPARLVSAFETRRLYILFAKLIGFSLAGLSAAGLLLLFLAPALLTLPDLESMSSGVIVLPVILYLGGVTAFAAAKELILNQGFWRHATATLGIDNLAAANDIIGTGVTPEAATGEGLGDALDFGGV
jgi:uncharacterized membrane protein YjgN (DUF898 family)